MKLLWWKYYHALFILIINIFLFDRTRVTNTKNGINL